MKAATLLAAALLLTGFLGCTGSARNSGTDSTVNTKLAAAGDSVWMTLDGMPQDSAVKAFQRFKAADAKTFKLHDTWYHVNKKMFYAMVKFLEVERDKEDIKQGKEGKIDGIRIYFYKKNQNDTSPSIAFVATRDSSITHPAGPESTSHRDFYRHKKDSLFTMSDRTILMDHNSDGGGAGMYGDTELKLPDCDGDGNINYPVAKEMVKTFRRNAGKEFKTYSVWYKLSMLKIQSGMNSTGGLRLYLVSHIAGEIDRVGGWHLDGDLTFMLVPTNKGSGTMRFQDDYSCPSFTWTKNNLTDNGELCPHHCN